MNILYLEKSEFVSSRNPTWCWNSSIEANSEEKINAVKILVENGFETDAVTFEEPGWSDIVICKSTDDVDNVKDEYERMTCWREEACIRLYSDSHKIFIQGSKSGIENVLNLLSVNYDEFEN